MAVKLGRIQVVEGVRGKTYRAQIRKFTAKLKRKIY